MDVHGLAEKEWCGPEQCEIYKRLNNMSSLNLCKQGGRERCQMKI